MDIFRGLNREPEAKEPAIWVKRLAVFARGESGEEPIRNVRLERGVNIIWAREDEEDGGEAPITGHSAGKTTFCRLLRYCLGEKTYGTSASMKAIAGALPNGCVAAELRVMGQDLAVMRPIGIGVYSYFLRGATIEELLKKGGKRTTIDTYAESLGIDALMSRLESSGLTATGDEVEWDHILAWCSRDQEARFRNLHEWRSARSESEAASFRFKKAGPMQVMRMALGLYEEDEIQGEERLADLQKLHDTQSKDLEAAQREPAVMLKHHREEVAGIVTVELPGIGDVSGRKLRSDELEECLSRLSARASAGIGERIARAEAQVQAAQDAIEDCLREEGEIGSRIKQFKVSGKVSGAAGEAEESSAAILKNLEGQLAEHGAKTCPYGGVVINDCTAVGQRIWDLKGTAVRDAYEQEVAEARSAEVMHRIRSELAVDEARVRECQDRRTVLRNQKADLDRTLADERSRQSTLDGALQNAVKWEDILAGGEGTDRVAQLKRALAATESEQKEINDRLNRNLRQHDKNRDLLTGIFSAAVRSVLPATEYDGVVEFENRALRFSVKRGNVMTGEAVETLSILLADVSCLLYNVLNKRSCLPGFLIHDSPREADLGARIYRQFIRFVVAQQRHFGSRDECPFQYVLTTTTPPPSELEKGDEFVKARLNAAVADELLLRRNLAVVLPRLVQEELV